MATINARIRARRDTTANWNSVPGFIPMRGEIIVYTDHGTVDDGSGGSVPVPGVKIGDGSAYLIDLPFVGDDDASRIMTALRGHAENHDIHVTASQKTFWDSKLNCVVDEGNLIFNRN